MILPNKLHTPQRNQDIKIHIFSIPGVSAYRFIVADLNSNVAGGLRNKNYLLTARRLKDT